MTLTDTRAGGNLTSLRRDAVGRTFPFVESLAPQRPLRLNTAFGQRWGAFGFPSRAMQGGTT